jgi:hypothetical protein
MPTAFLKFYTAKRDVEVVVDNYHILEGKFVKPERRSHRATGEIHEGLWFQQEKPISPQIPLAVKSGEIFPGERNTGQVRKPV